MSYSLTRRIPRLISAMALAGDHRHAPRRKQPYSMRRSDISRKIVPFTLNRVGFAHNWVYVRGKKMDTQSGDIISSGWLQDGQGGANWPRSGVG